MIHPRIGRIGRTVLTLFALLIAACGAQSGGQANASPAAATAAGPASQTGAKGVCANPYMPVVNGATWTYAVTTNVTGASTSSSAITDVTAGSFTLAVKSPDVNWTETWSCNKNGLLQLQNNGGATGATFSGPDGTATVTTKSNTGLTLPQTMKPGDSWAQTTDFAVDSSGTPFGTSTTTYTFKAIGMESVKVPAGTFDAMRVDLKADSAFTYKDGNVLKTSSTGSSWWVKGKGLVKGTMTTGIGASDVSYEQDLQSMQIP